jgi:hypothetical protein
LPLEFEVVVEAEEVEVGLVVFFDVPVVRREVELEGGGLGTVK